MLALWVSLRDCVRHSPYFEYPSQWIHGDFGELLSLRRVSVDAVHSRARQQRLRMTLLLLLKPEMALGRPTARLDLIPSLTYFCVSQ